MKYLISSVFSLILCLGAWLGSPAASAEPVTLDRVIAVVNDDVVLESELTQLIDSVKRRSDFSQLPPEAILQRQALDRLIMQQLQLQLAERGGLRISERQLDQTLRGIAQDQGLTLDQLRNQVVSEGLNWSVYREGLRKELLANQVTRSQVQRRIYISPQEIELMVAEMTKAQQSELAYQLRQIMLRTDDDASEAESERVRQQAIGLLEEFRNGKDFAELALRWSQGPGALQGGLMAPMPLDEIPSLFADALAERISAGEGGVGTVVGPLRSGIGWHLLYVEAVEGEQSVSLTEVDARHVLVKTNVVVSDTQARRQLADLRNKILAGELNFAEVASVWSDDTGSAIKGGELGWQDPALYVPAFKQQVEELPLNQISEPFKTEHGWHIVEVKQRRSRDATAEHQQESAWRVLFNRKFNEEAESWLSELRSQAYIEILDPKLDPELADNSPNGF